MRKLFRTLFFIPRLFLRVIWKLFWGIVKTVLVLSIICMGLLYYANNSDSQLAQAITTVSNNLSTYFSNLTSEDISNSLSELSTDSFTFYSGSLWETNSATVYIATSDKTLIKAYQDAISNWNETGSFTFTIVDDEVSADIICTDYSDATSQAAGLAETQTNTLTKEITHVDVKLNTYYLTENNYGYNQSRIVNTAEHELGHAIGLDHDDSEISVMQSSGSYYGIQSVDIEKVVALYNS